MVQKVLIGVVELEEQHEIDRIGRQRNAKNRGEAIQVTPLHEALIEVHREYDMANRATKDMAEAYKRGTTATDQLQDQWTKSQAKNDKLSEIPRQTEEKLKEPDQQFQQQLQEAEKKAGNTTTRTEAAKHKVMKLEDHILLTKNKIRK